MINLHEIFTRCSSRNINSDYLDKIWLTVKYSLLVVMQCWRHSVLRVQTGLSQPLMRDLLNSCPILMVNFISFIDDKLLKF